MTDELERRWDDVVEQAWTEFRQRLGDRLAELGEGETLLVELPQDDEVEGASPYCQVAANEEWLRVEAVSNEFLDQRFSLADQQESDLCELGFAEPEEGRSPNFWLDLEQREADRAAVLLIQAMRQVYGVLHPVYLDAGGLEPPPEEPEDDLHALLAAVESTMSPEDADDVRRALGETVALMLGHEPEWDEDGDLPIVTERSVLYVSVASKMPRILIHAAVLVDVVDEQRALSEVNVLNRQQFGLTFVLHEGRISVRRELPVGVFVPDEVRAEIQRIADNLDEWIGDLLIRVGGRTVLDDGPARQPQAGARRTPESGEPDDERFRQAMRVLKELESEERGSVDPATMVRIFHSDRDLLLAAIRHALSRSTTWGSRRRSAEQEGRAGAVRTCRAQQRYYRELRSRLRRALRLTVQSSVRRERQAQLSLFSEDEATA